MARAFTWILTASAVLLCASPARALPAPSVPPRNKIFRMLESGDYKGLEELTDRLREARIGFYNGWPLIHVFYDDLSFYTTDDAVWTRYIGCLSKWQAAYPDSPSPRIALANLYKDYAWEARGSGWASSVTENGWKLFGDRLATSQRFLDGAKALKTQDAEAHLCQLVLARGLGLSKDVVDDALSRGLAIDPDFTPLYAAKAAYLLPRWNGAPGEWEAFATEAADKRGGDDGDLLYMFIVRSVAYTEEEKLFKDAGVSYERMKRGFLVSRSRHPANTFDLNSFCYFASIAGDTETASRLFDQIGPICDMGVWGTKEQFTMWQNRAKQGGFLAAPVPHAFSALNGVGIAIIIVLIGFAVFFLRPPPVRPPPGPPSEPPPLPRQT